MFRHLGTGGRIPVAALVFFLLLSARLPACGAHPGAGIILADDQGQILFSQNRDRPFVPASILKILTSLFALHHFGPDYRFPTFYFHDPASGNLFLRGTGDPMLTSEAMAQLCREILDSMTATHFHDIVLDQSYFADPIHIPGRGPSLNPYDATVGALSANFNTITFRWDSQTSGFVSNEPQTPLPGLFLEDIRKTRMKQGRIVLSPEQSRIYPGLLLQCLLAEEGIEITGSVRISGSATNDIALRTFLSPFSLETVLQMLLEYSNNFIANQILLAIGAEVFGPPAMLEKGTRAMNQFIQSELKLSGIVVDEGSGLSRQNRITPDQMLHILNRFGAYRHLLPGQNRDFFKTGTLTGVRTRAGYLLGKDNRFYPYVIMINQPDTGYDEILARLQKMVDRIGKQPPL